MANVLHRTTLQYRASVNTPDFDPSVWIINPDMSAVANIPQKHWKIVGDKVSQMTAAEKIAKDKALQDAIDLAANPVEHADNAAAIVAGLKIGNTYRTGDVLKVVHL